MGELRVANIAGDARVADWRVGDCHVPPPRRRSGARSVAASAARHVGTGATMLDRAGKATGARRGASPSARYVTTASCKALIKIITSTSRPAVLRVAVESRRAARRGAGRQPPSAPTEPARRPRRRHVDDRRGLALLCAVTLPAPGVRALSRRHGRLVHTSGRRDQEEAACRRVRRAADWRSSRGHARPRPAPTSSCSGVPPPWALPASTTRRCCASRALLGPCTPTSSRP
jgi:hypothetical protein